MVIKSFRMAVLGVAVLAAGALAAETQPADPSLGAGKVVALDEFFNHQEKNGKQFHYVWEDTAASGFSKFGEVWKENGAQISKFDHAPTADDLKTAAEEKDEEGIKAAIKRLRREIGKCHANFQEPLKAALLRHPETGEKL